MQVGWKGGEGGREGGAGREGEVGSSALCWGAFVMLLSLHSHECTQLFITKNNRERGIRACRYTRKKSRWSTALRHETIAIATEIIEREKKEKEVVWVGLRQGTSNVCLEM